MSFDLFSAPNSSFVTGPIIIGAGPSGLAVAATLRESGVPFLILERADCIASLWQNRTYDRLKLHLPKKFCELPKLPFPEDYPEYPNRKQFISYLESYARRFEINPNFNESVVSARYDETCGLWRVETVKKGGVKMNYICQSIVVATGENAESVMPEMEGIEDFDGDMVHVSEYKSGKTYKGKKVLVVGCGNSGMEVSLDLCNHGASPSMVVKDSVHVLPREVLGKSTFEIAVMMMGWLPLWLVDKILVILAWAVLGSTDKYGIPRPSIGPMALKNIDGKTPVLDIGALEMIRSGDIKVVPAVKRLLPYGVELVDGLIFEVDSVIFATGYQSNVPSWLQEAEFFSKDGFPRKPFPNCWKGKSGLYACGFTRRGLSGLSMDAVKIANDIGKVWREETRHAKRQTACHRRCISQF